MKRQDGEGGLVFGGIIGILEWKETGAGRGGEIKLGSKD